VEPLDPSIPYITNAEVARILFHIAALLEMTQDNMYRVRAYRRAALGVMYLPRPVAEYVAAGIRPPVPGMGERIHHRLKDLVNTGQMGVYQTLLDEIGEPIVSLLSLRGVGPKTAMRLVHELKIGSIEDLAAAARQRKIRTLRGFAEKRETKLGSQAEALLDDRAAA
jgi:DNA polymerase (family 10)